MSIAAAENAGHSPCDLPDHWASAISSNNSSSSINNSSIPATTTTLPPLQLLSTSTAINNNNNANINNSATTYQLHQQQQQQQHLLLQQQPTTSTITLSGAATKSTPPSNRATTTTTPQTTTICNLPLSSPAAATAAVTAAAATAPGQTAAAPAAATAAAATAGGRGLSLTGGGIGGGSVGGLGGIGGIAGGGAAGGGGGGGGSSVVGAGAAIGGGPYRCNTTTANYGQTAGNSGAAASLLLQNNLNIINSNNNNNNNNNTNIINNNNNNLQQQKAAQVASFTAALQRSVTMNAVASPISANAATPNRKIRRKTDSKTNLPQSQINKCNNEKRRREMENNYIEQLSEFLQLNKRGDMTSTKPDKAAILNQVVKTYRDICDKGQSRDISSSTNSNNGGGLPAGSATLSSSTASSASSASSASPAAAAASNSSSATAGTHCSRCATDNCSIHPVQQGEVSSTEPPLPEASLLNGQVPEISAYFEALEHYISSVDWVLLQVNGDGLIESCTKNIRELIGYEKQELQRTPLYMYLYPGDRAKLDPIINNMSYGGGGGGGGGLGIGPHLSGLDGLDEAANGGNGSTMGGRAKRSISTKVRMLVKDTRSATQTSTDGMDQKTLRHMGGQDKFAEVVLIAAPVKDDGDSSSSVLCLITRPEDESPLEMNIQQHVPQQPVEQMTFKLDIHGKILSLDSTALREPFKQHVSTYAGRLLHDICHPQDLSMLKSHLRDIQETNSVANSGLNAGQSPGSTGGGGGVNPPISNVISRPFRLRLGSPDVYVHVKANSRLFLNHTPNESDFIMSVQTLLNTENDMNSNNTLLIGSAGGGSCSSGLGSGSGSSGLGCVGLDGITSENTLVSLLSSIAGDSPMSHNSNGSSSNLLSMMGGGGGGGGHQMMVGGLVGGGGGGMQSHGGQANSSNGGSSVGGPLMTSAMINGGAGAGPPGNAAHQQQQQQQGRGSSATPSNNSSLVNSFTTSPAGPAEFYNNDQFDIDLTHSFEMGNWTDSRPNSRASVTTPVSTPRPPSTGHGFSPSTPHQWSSHSAASMPSPQSNASQPSQQYGSFNLGSFDTAGSDKSSSGEKDHLNNNNNSNNNNNNNSSNNNNTSNNNNPMMGQMPNGVGGGGSSTIMGVASMGGGVDQNSSSQPPQRNAPHPKQPSDSERLRHLLTHFPNTSSSMHSSEGGSGGGGDDREHNLLKYFNKHPMGGDEDKEVPSGSGSGSFKLGSGGPSRLFGGSIGKSANSSNPMLLSLLNDKSEDDDGKGSSASGRGQKELRQLQKSEGGSGGGGSAHNNHISDEELKKILKIQTDSRSLKRPLNEPDDGSLAKRSEDRKSGSRLRDQNQMLASLLENPPKNPVLHMAPKVKVIPDIMPNRVSSSLGGGSGSALAGMGMVPKAASGSGSGATGRGRSKQQNSEAYLTQQQQQQQLQQQQNMAAAAQQRDSQMSPFGMGGDIDRLLTASAASSGVAAQHKTPNNNATTTTPATSLPSSAAGSSAAAAMSSAATANATSMQSSCGGALASLDRDTELSKILDSVMEYVENDQPFVPTPPNSAMAGLTQQEFNERVAISAIQKNLIMETSSFAQHQSQQMQQQQQKLQQQSQPPAYPGTMMGGGGGMTAQQQQQQQQQQQMLQLLRANQLQQQQGGIGVGGGAGGLGGHGVAGGLPMQMMEAMRANANQGFQRPPPVYPARARAPLNAVATPAGVVPYRNRNQQSQLTTQKERLLMLQANQQMLVPESATARNDQLCLNPGMNNIGNLINSGVAPNVSLSRTNMPPDSQLSPNFTSSMMQQQLSPGQRNAPFSPQPNQGYGPQFPQNAQRLSPQQQQQQQQMASAFQNSQVAAQLSPRQSPFGAGGGNTTVNGVQSPGVMPQNASPQWAGNAAANQRAHSLQQHNPMLSAQLQSVGPYNARQFQNQRRGLNSPGAVGGAGAGGGAVGAGGNAATAALQRQNSFQTGDNGFSVPPNSPTAAQFGPAGANVFQQQQMQRMQRQGSVPQATQHLPGSPRPFGSSASHDSSAGGGGSCSSSSLHMNGSMSGCGHGPGGYGGGMMYNANSMQQQGPAGPQPPPPPQATNDFYGRTQAAGNTPNSSEYVKQELRAVVSGRAQQQTAAAAAAAANAGGNGVPGGGGGAGMRVNTPQSPLSMGNSTNAAGLSGGNSTGNSAASSVGGGNSAGSGSNSLMNSQNDPTLGFNFDLEDVFCRGSTR